MYTTMYLTYMAYKRQYEGISRKQLVGYSPKGTHIFPLILLKIIQLKVHLPVHLWVADVWVLETKLDGAICFANEEFAEARG